MITFTHCSLTRNSRDVTIKYVHGEKHSDVNRPVVVVFEVAIFGVGGMNFVKLHAVLSIIHPIIRRLIVIEIYGHLGNALYCRKMSA